MRSQAGALPRADERRMRIRAAASARAELSDRHLLGARIAHTPGGEARLLLEPLEAPTLARVMRRGPLAPKTAVTAVAGVARAVQVLERRRLVARDLTPDHVLLDRRRGAVLAEYGLPPQLVPLGRPQPDPKAFYRAPEETGGRLTQRSSVYSLGALLLAALTGEAQTERPGAKNGTRNGRRSLPPALAAVIERAMAPDPSLRFADAAEFTRAAVEAVRAPERESSNGRKTRSESQTRGRGETDTTKPRAARTATAKPAAANGGATKRGTAKPAGTNGGIKRGATKPAAANGGATKRGTAKPAGTNRGGAKQDRAAKAPRLLSRLHLAPAPEETTPAQPHAPQAPTKKRADTRAAEAAKKAAKRAEDAKRGAAERAERERRAKEAADRKKAEAAARDLAKRAERERRAKEAAERKAAEKAERERRAAEAAERKQQETERKRIEAEEKQAEAALNRAEADRKRQREATVRSSNTGRRRRAVAITVVGLLAAAAGALVLAPGSDTGAGSATKVSNGELSMRLPAGWQQIEPATARFGSLSSVLAAQPSNGDRTLILTGMVGEPRETTATLRRLAPDGTKPVPARLGSLEVTRYDNLRPSAGSKASAYMLNTTGPSVLIVCEAAAAAGRAPLHACADVASSLHLENELPRSRASAKTRRPAAEDAIAELTAARLAARKRIATATLAEDQSKAARDLQVVYYATSRRVEATGLPGAGAERLVAALAAAGDSYGALATAIQDGDQMAYDDARSEVVAREADVWSKVPDSPGSAPDQP